MRTEHTDGCSRFDRRNSSYQRSRARGGKSNQHGDYPDYTEDRHILMPIATDCGFPSSGLASKIYIQHVYFLFSEMVLVFESQSCHSNCSLFQIFRNPLATARPITTGHQRPCGTEEVQRYCTIVVRKAVCKPSGNARQMSESFEF